MDVIFQRLKEPSTYAGLAAFLAGFGLLGLNEQDWNQVLGALAAIAGVARDLHQGKGGEAGDKTP